MEEQRATKRVKRTTVARLTIPVPWEPLLQTLVALLQTAIETHVQAEWRTTVSLAIESLQVLCREARVQAGSIVTKYMLFYEHWRRMANAYESDNRSQSKPKMCFLDVWPSFVDVNGPVGGIATSDRAAVRRLDVRSAIADRFTCINALETQLSNLGLVQERFNAPGIPLGVPRVINIFIGRARFMYGAIKEVHNEEEFAECRVCGREFFCGAIGDDDEDDSDCDLEGDLPPPLGTAESQSEYWRLCGGQLPVVSPHEKSLCCSAACCARMQREIEIAMACSANELVVADATTFKEGAPRVPSAYRAAIKRNEIIGRRMRATENGDYNILSCREVGTLRSMSCTMLNVDIALLHAASHMVESPALVAGRIIPPMQICWRSMPTLCRGSVVACRAIYNAYKPQDTTPVVAAAIKPRFLGKCRDKAHTIF